jgi:hypothetical protein
MEKMLKSMEEARNAIPEVVRKKLNFMWEHAQKTDGQAVDTKLIAIGIVSDRLNTAISKELGKKVKAEIQYIRFKDVRHFDDVHGVGKENDPNQIPVTKEAFMLLPNVLKNFDEVKKGSETVGRESVKITKHYSDGRIVIANAVLDGGDLTITDMFIKKPAAVSPRNA